MLGTFLIGAILGGVGAVVLVNLLSMATGLIWGWAEAEWIRQKPSPFDELELRMHDHAGTLPPPPRGLAALQFVPTVACALSLSAFTAAFTSRVAQADGAFYSGLGFLAVLALQASNIRGKLAEARKGNPVSRAAVPWALAWAPVGWLVYGAVLHLSPGAVTPLDWLGQATTSVALALGDWFFIKLVAYLLTGITFLSLGSAVYLMVRARRLRAPR